LARENQGTNEIDDNIVFMYWYSVCILKSKLVSLEVAMVSYSRRITGDHGPLFLLRRVQKCVTCKYSTMYDLTADLTLRIKPAFKTSSIHWGFDSK